MIEIFNDKKKDREKKTHNLLGLILVGSVESW